jgi:hypothetical protein
MVVKRWGVAICAVLAMSAATADVTPAQKEFTKTAVIDMGPGCRIRLQVPQKAGYGGIPPESGFPGRGGITVENPLNQKRKTYIEPLYLRFICHDADPEALSQSAPLRYDARAQTWRKDMQKLYDLYIEPSPSFKRELDRAVRIHEMKSVNAQGFAYTLDDVTGEESTRRRVLYYCLMHGPKAVCNSFDTRMGYLPDIQRNPRNDLTPYALKILRSIEFIDDATTPATPAAPQPASR